MDEEVESFNEESEPPRLEIDKFDSTRDEPRGSIVNSVRWWLPLLWLVVVLRATLRIDEFIMESSNIESVGCALLGFLAMYTDSE